MIIHTLLSLSLFLCVCVCVCVTDESSFHWTTVSECYERKHVKMVWEIPTQCDTAGRFCYMFPSDEVQTQQGPSHLCRVSICRLFQLHLELYHLMYFILQSQQPSHGIPNPLPSATLGLPLCCEHVVAPQSMEAVCGVCHEYHSCDRESLRSKEPPHSDHVCCVGISCVLQSTRSSEQTQEDCPVWIGTASPSFHPCFKSVLTSWVCNS